MIYVIGHLNPDSDAICTAMMTGALADVARAGGNGVPHGGSQP